MLAIHSVCCPINFGFAYKKSTKLPNQIRMAVQISDGQVPHPNQIRPIKRWKPNQTNFKQMAMKHRTVTQHWWQMKSLMAHQTVNCHRPAVRQRQMKMERASATHESKPNQSMRMKMKLSQCKQTITLSSKLNPIPNLVVAIAIARAVRKSKLRSKKSRLTPVMVYQRVAMMHWHPVAIKLQQQQTTINRMTTKQQINKHNGRHYENVVDTVFVAIGNSQ